MRSATITGVSMGLVIFIALSPIIIFLLWLTRNNESPEDSLYPDLFEDINERDLTEVKDNGELCTHEHKDT